MVLLILVAKITAMIALVIFIFVVCKTLERLFPKFLTPRCSNPKAETIELFKTLPLWLCLPPKFCAIPD